VHHRSTSTQRDFLNNALPNRDERGWKSWLNWATFKQRVPYYIPIMIWLPKYNIREDLPRDIGAGLAVGAMVVPQSLALAILAGLPPIYGLYSCWVSYCFPLFDQVCSAKINLNLLQQ